MIKRLIDIKSNIREGKVLIIYGPRQIGKTTLVKQFLKETKLRYRFDTGDNFEIVSNLSQCTYQSTRDHVGNYDLIVIDEAQKIPHIGTALKLMADTYPEKYLIATGSSSFELANKTSESLTGRKRVVTLYPVSQTELALDFARSELVSELENYLIFGGYPEVFSTNIRTEKEEIIRLIANSYLIKDILEFDKIKNSETLYRLLKLLAFQIGSQVSMSELAQQISIDVKTVQNYIDLLVKSFVIFPLHGFSRNLRSEVTKMSKYYFYDLGIRNALISNFNKLENRNDVGELWENFLIAERIKKNDYSKSLPNIYFWRTYRQKEIDYIEEKGGWLYGYEFKFKPKSTTAPSEWLENYPEAQFEEVSKDNYLDFIL